MKPLVVVFALVLFSPLSRADKRLYERPRPAPTPPAPTYTYRLEADKGRPIATSSPCADDSGAWPWLLKQIARVDVVAPTPTGVVLYLSDERVLHSAGGARELASGSGFFDAGITGTMFVRLEEGPRRATFAVILRDRDQPAKTCAVKWRGIMIREAPRD